MNRLDQLPPTCSTALGQFASRLSASFEYRRRFVVELLMALHDSALASTATKRTALLTMSSTVRIPAYAMDLVDRSGQHVCLTNSDVQHTALLNIYHYIFISHTGSQQRSNQLLLRLS